MLGFVFCVWWGFFHHNLQGMFAFYKKYILHKVYVHLTVFQANRYVFLMLWFKFFGNFFSGTVSRTAFTKGV